MKFTIVADSSANLPSLPGLAYSSVALKILAGEREYVDDANLDTGKMLEELSQYKGKTGTACPSVGEWVEAFGDGEGVFAIAITSGLSGSYNAAVQAKAVYEEQHPGRKVCCLDSLSTGPEMVLIAEKLAELIGAGLEFEEIEARIRAYMERTKLLFILESVDNLAKNGRVSTLVAKAVGILGIRIVGVASEVGTLEPLHKARGEKKGLAVSLKELAERGYAGGRVRIAHVHNLRVAELLKAQLLELYPNADIQIAPCGGLCCFYAEQGGVLVGFET